MKNKIEIENLSFSYGSHKVLNNLSVQFKENQITAIIGPSGLGKSTLLSVLNRLWESIPNVQMEGVVKINLNGSFTNIYDKSVDVAELRRSVGTLFQAPNPLPMSIFKNVALPLKLQGEKNRDIIAQKVETVLKQVQLWDEVKDRLNKSAIELSGGQQQRLCIARALILNPEVILFDEPTSSLDEESRLVIENLITSLKNKSTVVMISHYLEQVNRIADEVYELKSGKLTSVVV